MRQVKATLQATSLLHQVLFLSDHHVAIRTIPPGSIPDEFLFNMEIGQHWRPTKPHMSWSFFLLPQAIRFRGEWINCIPNFLVTFYFHFWWAELSKLFVGWYSTLAGWYHWYQKLGDKLRYSWRPHPFSTSLEWWLYIHLYLAGGLEHDFYDFPYIGNNHPNWRTHIFQRVGIPPTRCFSYWKLSFIADLPIKMVIYPLKMVIYLPSSTLNLLSSFKCGHKKNRISTSHQYLHQSWLALYPLVI